MNNINIDSLHLLPVDYDISPLKIGKFVNSTSESEEISQSTDSRSRIYFSYDQNVKHIFKLMPIQRKLVGIPMQKINNCENMLSFTDLQDFDSIFG